MKNLFQSFFPTEQVKTASEITPGWLAERGVKGVVFDIDNTVVPQDEPANEAAKAYFRSLHEAGIKTFILSNNSEPRVKAFAEEVGCDYFFKAQKPSRRGYLAAIRRMHLRRRELIAVGDQLFTDICGANRARIRSVLVEPLAPEKDTVGVRFKRPFERLVFRSWMKRRQKEGAKEEKARFCPEKTQEEAENGRCGS